jgi:polar amino acid transport system permease protein
MTVAQTEGLTLPATTMTEPPKVIARKHPGRWVAVVLILAVVVGIVEWAVTNKNFGWPDFRHYLFTAQIMHGVWHTVLLSVTAEVVSLVVGTLLAVMRLSENKVISGFSFFYSWFFRSIPLPVLLVFIFFCSAVLPRIGWGSLSVDSNTVFSSPFIACLIGFGMNDAAYTSEFVRAGLMSVPKGQTEAAYAIGMTPARAMWRIVLPQALRFIVPPAGNGFIGLLKLTSIAMVIGYGDVMNTVRSIYSTEFNTIPMLLVASFWYLVLTTVLSIGQYYIERYYGRGFQR